MYIAQCVTTLRYRLFFPSLVLPPSMKNLLFTLSISTMFVGCANVEQQREALEKPGACCTQVIKAQVTEMRATSQVIRIGSADPIGEFSEGKSRYKLLSLPAGTSEGKRTIKLGAKTQITKVFSGGGSWEPYFHPSVTFFDSARTVITSVTATEEPTKPDACGRYFGCAIVELAATIPEAARFIAVHQPQRLLGKTYVQVGAGMRDAQTVPVAGAFITIGPGLPGRRVIVMAEGDIEVEVNQ